MTSRYSEGARPFGVHQLSSCGMCTHRRAGRAGPAEPGSQPRQRNARARHRPDAVRRRNPLHRQGHPGRARPPELARGQRERRELGHLPVRDVGQALRQPARRGTCDRLAPVEQRRGARADRPAPGARRRRQPGRAGPPDGHPGPDLRLPRMVGQPRRPAGRLLVLLRQARQAQAQPRPDPGAHEPRAHRAEQARRSQEDDVLGPLADLSGRGTGRATGYAAGAAVPAGLAACQYAGAVLDTALRERLTAAYEAFFRRDLATTMSVFAPDVVAFDAPEMPDTGTFEGRDALEARLAGFLELFEEIELRELQIDDVAGRVLIHFEVQGLTGGAAPPVGMAITH